MGKDDANCLGWLSRLHALLQENEHAEVYVNDDDDVILSYGPEADDEVEIGNRRKCHLVKIREHLAEYDA
jgi:hypothetical protein